MRETGFFSVALASAGSEAPKEWLHLLPKGTFRGRDGRGPYHVPDPALTAQRSLPAGARPLPIDFNHAMDLAAKHGGDAPAAGWITALQARNDGVWGKVEWTEKGGAAVQGREYRYVSPAFGHSADGTVGRLLRAALTNIPNLEELTALHNRRTHMDPNGALATLRELVGLDASTDWQDVVEGVRALCTSRNTADPAKYVPIELFQQAVAEANRLNAGVSKHTAEMIVSRAAREGKIFPWMHDWAVSLCMANRDAYDKFEGGIGQSIHSAMAMLQTDFSDHFTRPVPGSPQEQSGELGATIDRAFGVTAQDRAKLRGTHR